MQMAAPAHNRWNTEVSTTSMSLISVPSFTDGVQRDASLRITAGYLVVIVDHHDLGGEIASEHSSYDYQVVYVWFRWLYSFMRLHGLGEPRWELSIMRSGYSVVLIDQLRGLIYPHLRVSYPSQLHQPLLICNTHSSTYMRVSALTAQEAIGCFNDDFTTYPCPVRLLQVTEI